MSSNIWAVLNDVSDDTDKPKLKKKPVNAKKGGNQANQKTNQTAAGGKPQLTEKAARAFRDGQQPKQPKPQQPKKVAAQPAKSQPAKSPVPAPSSSSSAAAPAKQQGPAIVVKKPAAAPAPVQAPAPQGVPQKAQNYVKALNQVLNGQAAFFQVSLMRSSEVGVLQSNPYRVVGDMVKSPQFVTNLGLALKKDAKEFAKKDVRAKILGRVNRIGLAHHLLALLSGHSPVGRSKTDEETTRLVTGFLEALWNITPPAEPVKRVEVDRVEVADEEDEMIGSAGNVKRDAMTLSDFITIKPAKVKGGKKGGKPQPPAQQTGKGKEKVDAPAPTPAAQPAAPAPAASSPTVETAAAAQPQAQVPEGKKDDPTSWRTDLVDSAKQLSRRIPANIQCVRVEPAFLWSAEEVKASGKQQPHYFKGQGCDHCYAFWEDGKGDIYFLVTNGSA